MVVDFDSGSLDEQAALLLYLDTKVPLALVVFSGSKSLHGWFPANPGWEEFFRTASRLGADSTLATPCQFARMPGGRRSDNGATQSVYRRRNTRSEAHGLPVGDSPSGFRLVRH